MRAWVSLALITLLVIASSLTGLSPFVLAVPASFAVLAVAFLVRPRVRERADQQRWESEAGLW